MSQSEIIILEGAIAGVLISLPKGPAGFFIINQTVVHGWKKGVIIAFGCITTTFLVSLIVIFPKFQIVENLFTFLANAFSSSFWSSLIGGILLISIAIFVLRLKQADFSEMEVRIAEKRFLFVFFGTFLDPMTTLQTIKVFKYAPDLCQWLFGVSTVEIFQCDRNKKILFFCAVIAGTLLWYVVSTLIIHCFSGKRFFPSIGTINKFFAVLFFIGGAYLLFPFTLQILKFLLSF